MKDNNNLPRKVQETYGEFLKSIDGFFHDAFQHFHNNGLFAPSFPVQTYESGSEYIIEAELPGVKKDQIELDIFQNHARIRVKNEEMIETMDDSNQVIHQQQSFSQRERIVPLPNPVTEKEIKASYRDGLLRIEIPNNRKVIDIE